MLEASWYICMLPILLLLLLLFNLVLNTKVVIFSNQTAQCNTEHGLHGIWNIIMVDSSSGRSPPSSPPPPLPRGCDQKGVQPHTTALSHERCLAGFNRGRGGEGGWGRMGRSTSYNLIPDRKSGV